LKDLPDKISGLRIWNQSEVFATDVTERHSPRDMDTSIHSVALGCLEVRGVPLPLIPSNGGADVEVELLCGFG